MCVCVCVCVCVCIINIRVRHEVKYQRGLIMKNGQDVYNQMRSGTIGAPDRVNIPRLMHDTRLYQLDIKMTNNYHGTKQDINTKPVMM